MAWERKEQRYCQLTTFPSPHPSLVILKESAVLAVFQFGFKEHQAGTAQIC
jgi:hypothetical protein